MNRPTPTEPPGRRPLAGKLVIVACSRLKADVLISGLEALGARVVPFESIVVRGLHDGSGLDAALDRLPEYDWLVFTSAHAVARFAEALSRRRPGTLPPSLNVCAIGPATAARAQAAGFRIALIPERYIGEQAAAALASAVQRGRVLLPRARVARDVIPEALEAAGAHVDVVPVYETVAGTVEPAVIDLVLRGEPDLLAFTSSSAVSNFVSILGEVAGREVLARTLTAAIGPVTAATAAALGKHVEIVPGEHTIPALLSSIALYFERLEHRE